MASAPDGRRAWLVSENSEPGEHTGHASISNVPSISRWRARERMSMATERPGTPKPIPEHLHTVTPRLIVRNGAAAIDFYRRAFGAEELGERFTGPQGELIHAEIRIGDSVVMISEDSDAEAPIRSPEALGGRVSAVMALYWENVDRAWDTAMA